MEEKKKLNLDAPLLSMRRIPIKTEHSRESENTKNKTKTMKKIIDPCQETDHETLVRLLLQDRSFDHVMKSSSVPFKWETKPVKPKDHRHDDYTSIEESDIIEALDMVSSTASFSVNCSSSNGVSDEFEKNGDRSKDDVSPEYRHLIMSRFLTDAKAMTMEQIKEKKKKKQSIALQRVSMAINQDFNNGSEKTVSKKALFGLCSKNSVDVLNPVLSRVKTCQDIGVKSGKIVNPKTLGAVNKARRSSSAAAAGTLPRILRSNKVLSKSQELYPLIIPRFSTNISLSKSGEMIQIPRNTSRLQRTASDLTQRQYTRFLAEEVKRRRNRDNIRSRNLSETSLLSVSQPPLPKTPSESWLCRTLPRSSAASSVFVSGKPAAVFSVQAGSVKKIDQRTIKWETMVKSSYKHQCHLRYSKELTGVHPSRQNKPETGILVQTEIPSLKYRSS